MTELKQCHTCGEEIKSFAKRCPHCSTWQSKWRLDPSDPKITVFLGILFIVCLVLIFYQLGNYEEKNFQDYASNLTVTDSKLNYGTTNYGSFISVIGKLKNESDIAWEDIHFEVNYYDSEGNLIDTVSSKDYGLVVLPHDESTFKVRGNADKKEEEYKDYRIIIKTAEEYKRWF